MIKGAAAFLSGDRLLGQLVRFGVTGVGATGLHAAIYLFSVTEAGVGPFAANLLGYAVAMPAAFAAHHFWSFRAQTREATASDTAAMVWRFLIINAIGFSLNALIIFLVCDVMGRRPELATVFMATVTPLITFLLNRNWGFRVAARAGAGRD